MLNPKNAVAICIFYSRGLPLNVRSMEANALQFGNTQTGLLSENKCALSNEAFVLFLEDRYDVADCLLDLPY